MGKTAYPPNNLKRLREEKGWTLDEAASAFGISRGGYIKIERSERRLTTDRVGKAADIFGVDDGEVFSQRPPANRTAGDSASARNPGRDRTEKIPLPARVARIAGVVEAGRFREAEDFGFSGAEVKTVAVQPDERFPDARQVAFRVAGNSMNAAKPVPILDGAILVCVDWEDITDAGFVIRPDLIVVIEQIRDGGHLREWSVKRMHYFDDRIEFRPESDDPSYRPIIVGRDFQADDGRVVKVLALVRAVHNQV